jgi:hypothetical protein
MLNNEKQEIMTTQEITKGQKITFKVTDYRMEPAISKLVTKKVQHVSFDCGKNVIGYLVYNTGSGSGFETVTPEQIVSVK